MLRAYKCRLYPNAEQREYFAQSFGCVRWVYNEALAYKIEHYQKNKGLLKNQQKKPLGTFDLQRRLTGLKKEYKWLKDVDSQSLNRAIKDLDIAYQNFYRRVRQGEVPGFPKFRSKHNGHHTFCVTQHLHVYREQKRLKIPKILPIKYRGLREFQGKIKNITISQVPSGKYYASILVDTLEAQISPAPLGDLDNVLGIDMGLNQFAICSDGTSIENPRYARKRKKQLVRAQRKLNRKTKGSNNRIKQKNRVAVIHEKIATARNDFLHKLTSRLIRENQTIALESLNIKGMIAKVKPKINLQGRYIANGRKAKSGLARSIADASWGEFNRQLEYKAKWGGVNIIRCGQYQPTSKTCNVCDYRMPEMALSMRTWKCPGCDTEHDRDSNAAINIKRFAYVTAVGVDRPELTPLEIM